jgi:hypothetical protein
MMKPKEYQLVVGEYVSLSENISLRLEPSFGPHVEPQGHVRIRSCVPGGEGQVVIEAKDLAEVARVLRAFSEETKSKPARKTAHQNQNDFTEPPTAA